MAEGNVIEKRLFLHAVLLHLLHANRKRRSTCVLETTIIYTVMGGLPKHLTSALESDASANNVPAAVATGTTHSQDYCPSY